MSSFSTAISALSAYSAAVDVVGHNLANLNTAGFKANSVAFFDVVSEQLGGGLGEGQSGFGVGRPITIRQFSQGTIQLSNGPLDAAIQGEGFLVVKDGDGRQLYTRGGNLIVDKAGTLVTPKGQKLQGWMADASGVMDSGGPIGDIVIPVGTIKEPVATTRFQIDLNLNAAAAVGNEFSTSVEVFDSLGVSHVVTATFTKSAENEWDYSLSIPNADVGAPVTPVTGTLEFTANGALQTPAAPGTVNFAIPGLTSGAADLNLTWDLYNGAASRITQFAQPSAPSANSQDGSPAAQLQRVGLVDGGVVMAQFSDGRQVAIGQLAMASIRNPESLVAVGDSSFALSALTSAPSIGLPDTGGRGAIVGGATEASTVDLAREFANLIVFQRGYQANSKVVTTMDEISQETVSLMRR